MAIAVPFQGKDAGKKLLLKVELFLQGKGFKEIALSARGTAVFFYKN